MSLPNHRCPRCHDYQIVKGWWHFMTSCRHAYWHCGKCNARLRLGDTPRLVAYSLVVAAALLGVGATPVLLELGAAWVLLIPAVALVLAFPLGFLVAYFIRGVVVNDSCPHVTEQPHALEPATGSAPNGTSSPPAPLITNVRRLRRMLLAFHRC